MLIATRADHFHVVGVGCRTIVAIESFSDASEVNRKLTYEDERAIASPERVVTVSCIPRLTQHFTQFLVGQFCGGIIRPASDPCPGLHYHRHFLG